MPSVSVPVLQTAWPYFFQSQATLHRWLEAIWITLIRAQGGGYNATNYSVFGAQHATLTLTADIIWCLVHNTQDLQQTFFSVWCTKCNTYTYSRRYSVFGSQHAALTLTADVIQYLMHNMQYLHLEQTCNTYTYSRGHLSLIHIWRCRRWP